MGLGCAICGQCVISVLLASYYHRYDEDEYWNELRYGSQYYGDAYYIALAGLVLSAITLASLLGEESQAVNYMVSFFDDPNIPDVKILGLKKVPNMNFFKASKFINYDVYNAFGSKLHVKYQCSICLVP